MTDLPQIPERAGMTPTQTSATDSAHMLGNAACRCRRCLPWRQLEARALARMEENRNGR